VSAGPAIERLLAAVAGAGLAGAAAAPPGALDDAAALELLDRARAERVVGLLDGAVAAGAVAVGGDAARRVGDAAVEVASATLVVERHTLDVHAVLDHAGVEHRFLKGSVLAHAFGGDPSSRSFADVDVLVPGAAVDAAVQALLAAGHRRLYPEWRPGFASTFGKSVTLRSAGGIEVDLHRGFAHGPFGVAGPMTAVWQRPAATVAVGGVELPALDPSTAFVHTCVHAVAGQRPTLANLRDVARTLAHADLDDVDDLEGALRVRACVVAAVDLTVQRLALGPDPARDGLRRRAVPRTEQRWLDAYGPRAHRFRHLTLMGLTAVPTVRGKVAYAAAIARR
jgi:hypothetical protein